MRIVVLGSGFAGTYTIRRLDRLFRNDDRVSMTVISRSNYMVFTPLLAEVAGNVVEPRHAVPPLRAFLRSRGYDAGSFEECLAAEDERIEEVAAAITASWRE